MCANTSRDGAKHETGRRGGAAAAVLRALIRVYQLVLSPLIGPRCRYLPTCSHYGEEAIARHGAWAGGWMVLARLARCNPLGPSGLDPVPAALPRGARWYMPWRYGRWRGRSVTPWTD